MHAGSGFSNVSVDSTDPTNAVRGKNIAYLNNLLIDMNAVPLPAGANGEGGLWRLFGPGNAAAPGGMANVTIDHNTGFGDTRFLNCDGTDINAPGFVMTNNLVNHGLFGAKCSGVGIGTASLNQSFPGNIFNTDVLVNIAVSGGTTALWPQNNQTCTSTNATCFPTDFITAGMVDYNNCNLGNFDPAKCALNPTSPYHNGGNDGKDIGADITRLPLTGVRP